MPDLSLVINEFLGELRSDLVLVVTGFCELLKVSADMKERMDLSSIFVKKNSQCRYFHN